ncbi:MAG: hypothetical protein A3H51_01155 [Candidatus Spechtbacteria bacterium RIFCSPLOWO2_02_FULL_38_8]|uniref:Ester cyclase n=1 Tax=Candidatus Spechtbacteria bacterium RIFCSPLOWO2_02_FULL_38_8 TaxID=1802164 RepID=A0A1G2HI16_9BACT|nr:MAG: hypothetical protein A3H51_01155 [Candidatus Spechtbacteria bacterium RIFCSPLOWO2_02_FULL_38_8]
MKSNQDIVAEFLHAIWNERDFSVIDRLVCENPLIRSPMQTKNGKETMYDIVEKWLAAFPDLTIQLDEFVSEGDKVVSRWTATGTHLGGFFDTKPTHKEITYTGMTIYHLTNGKIAAYWALVDIHAILTQLEEYDSIAEAIES